MSLLYILMTVISQFHLLVCDDLRFLFPFDNSHYTEGLSRYVWMYEEERVHVLEDLQYKPKPSEKIRGGAFNEYYLYTNENSHKPLKITPFEEKSIGNSPYDDQRPLIVIAHGQHGSALHSSAYMIKNAFLTAHNCNVIVLDWSKEAKEKYKVTLERLPGIGEKLAKFITWLINVGGGDWKQVHLVGYGVGAHIVGIAGRSCSPKLGRITGLSPTGYAIEKSKIYLRKGDADYVEIIHTNDNTHSSEKALADVDFYPNGGGKFGPQPGCYKEDPLCSTSRSYKLFAASVIYDSIFVGSKCRSYEVARLMKCKGQHLVLGGADWDKRGSGIYGLTTTGTFPYVVSRS